MTNLRFKDSDRIVYHTKIYNSNFFNLMKYLKNDIYRGPARYIDIEQAENNEVVLSCGSFYNTIPIETYIGKLYMIIKTNSDFNSDGSKFDFRHSEKLINFQTKLSYNDSININLSLSEISVYYDMLKGVSNLKLIKYYSEEYLDSIIKQPLNPLIIEQKALYEEMSKQLENELQKNLYKLSNDYEKSRKELFKKNEDAKLMLKEQFKELFMN